VLPDELLDAGSEEFAHLVPPGGDEPPREGEDQSCMQFPGKIPDAPRQIEFQARHPAPGFEYAGKLLEHALRVLHVPEEIGEEHGVEGRGRKRKDLSLPLDEGYPIPVPYTGDPAARGL